MMQRAGLVLALGFFATVPVAAQSVPLPESIWLSNGVGLSSAGVGFVGSWSAVFNERHLLSVRMSGAVEIPSLFGGDLVPEAVIDVGALFGRAWYDADARTHFSLAGGLAYVDGSRRGARIEGTRTPGFCLVFCGDRHERHRFQTVGVPFEARVMTTPWRYVGFGVGLFGNVNPERPYAGAAFQLHVGILR